MLDDAEVRAVVNELMAATEFDVLLTGATGHTDPYSRLRERAIDTLLSQGRDRAIDAIWSPASLERT